MEEKLLFPTNVFSGLVFNDFIEKSTSMVDTYAPYALRCMELDRSHGLVMDEDIHEVIIIDRLHPTPQWMSYDIKRSEATTKINWFIFMKLTCVAKWKTLCIYRHPVGVNVYVWEGRNGAFTYMLRWEEEG